MESTTGQATPEVMAAQMKQNAVGDKAVEPVSKTEPEPESLGKTIHHLNQNDSEDVELELELDSSNKNQDAAKGDQGGDLEQMAYSDDRSNGHGGMASTNSTRSSSDMTGVLLALIGLSSMALVTWLTILINNPFSMSWFAFHPPLQVLAIAFFGYGILTLQPTSLAQPKAKAAGFRRHEFFMFYLGLPSIFLGSLAIIVNKSVHGYPHFTTWHGFLGIIALGWMTIQIILGGGSVWYGGRYFGRNPKAVFKYHRASGYPLTLLFLLTIHLAGAWSNFALNNLSTFIRFFVFSVAPVAVAVGLGMRIRFDKMPIF